jgi:DNA-directed RNA polymerase specialized sigma subunit
MFKEDMISDGLENCIEYVTNFDPQKSSNPFAYFTQIIYFAFLRRIGKEKKQLEIKNRIIEKSGFAEVMAVDDSLLSRTSSDYNTIKENIQTKMNR